MELKTRTNQPVETGELEEELGKKVAKIEVTNIEQMSDEQLDALKVSDVVQKITGNMKHCYIVTYKEEKHGICLSYFACGYLETISYDYVGGHWVFNSKDVCETQEKITSSTDLAVKTLDVKQALYTLPVTIGDTGGRTLTQRYCKALVSGGVMYLVISVYIENETENSITAGSINISIPNIPPEVANKIVCTTGATVGDETLGNPQICSITFKYNSTFGDSANRYLFKNARYSINIPMYCPTLASGANTQIEGRTFILLF